MYGQVQKIYEIDTVAWNCFLIYVRNPGREFPFRYLSKKKLKQEN